MTISGGNILANIPDKLPDEQFIELLTTPSLRVERIVSTGHATPPGQSFDQDWPEWVLLVRGAAKIWFEGESEPRLLGPGDYLHIPKHARHRVEWTTPDEPTIWLAVHYLHG